MRGFGRGRAGRGWVRAGSDDEWDPELGDAPQPLPILDPKSDAIATRGMGGAERERNENGIRVVESPQSDVGSEFNIRAPYDPGAYAYDDPFSKTTVSHAALQRSQSPSLSSPTSSQKELGSIDEGHEVDSPGRDYRHRSTMSSVSVLTHAGSKFVEDI